MFIGHGVLVNDGGEDVRDEHGFPIGHSFLIGSLG